MYICILKLLWRHPFKYCPGYHVMSYTTPIADEPFAMIQHALMCGMPCASTEKEASDQMFFGPSSVLAFCKGINSWYW